MSKLKDVEGVSTAAEGFVFDYDGVTYKFTGNFAPMNQLLGLFKYGRGREVVGDGCGALPHDLLNPGLLDAAGHLRYLGVSHGVE